MNNYDRIGELKNEIESLPIETILRLRMSM